MNHRDFTDDLEPHYDDALNYCRALCARWSPAEAEEVFQNALLKALTGYASLKDRSRFRSWFFQILTRTFYSTVRGSFWKRFMPIQPDDGVEEPMPAVYARDEPHDDRHALYQALATLSATQRAALLLFELGGFSIEEIAVIQRAGSLSAVKSRLSRARQKLRDALSGAEPHPAAHRTPSFPEDLDHETITLAAQAPKNLR